MSSAVLHGCSSALMLVFFHLSRLVSHTDSHTVTRSVTQSVTVRQSHSQSQSFSHQSVTITVNHTDSHSHKLSVSHIVGQSHGQIVTQSVTHTRLQHLSCRATNFCLYLWFKLQTSEPRLGAAFDLKLRRRGIIVIVVICGPQRTRAIPKSSSDWLVKKSE
jgi:hypothetical protein